MDLRSGELRLLDRNQSTLLRSQPTRFGFPGREAHVAFRLSGRESFLGMGESSGPFNRAGLIQSFWNTDALGHGGINPGLRNLYTAIPFTVLLCDGRACGLFWDNPARQQWDLGQADRHLWQLTAAAGEIDLYLFTGPGVPDVVQRYSELTGRMPLPPRWALGYHQCRYSYQSRIELEKVARQLRRRRLPCDALYLDIHHMDGFRVFTFGRTFPKPAEMIARLRRRGFHTVAIVDPGVKVDPRFGVYQRGKRRGAYIRTPEGKRDYVGRVWPGRSVFPDFLNPSVRSWWGREQGKLQRAGVAGFWNDMNEPASFVPPTKTLPERCRHHTGHGPVRHSQAHNVYGMQMARASFDGSLLQQPDQRPFVITRAAYAGTQRHALIWTGDNASSWEHLADSVQMLLNLGLSGFPFCGGDAGGFLNNCTPELYARWMQMAAFTPFFRNHTMLGTVPHEPWCFGPEVESIVRKFIELRYQLLPYWYGLFDEAHRTGAPIMRPMIWHHQDDPVAAACGDQFLIGSSLLVAPVLQQGAVARSVYLPRGSWFDFWSGQRHPGGRHMVAEAPWEQMPVFVRAGTILPLTALRQHTGGRPDPVVNLHLWPGGRGELDWYEDDGESLHYTRGASHRRQILWNGRTLQFGSTEGRFASRVEIWRVVIRNARRSIPAGGLRSSVRFDPDSRIASAEILNTPEAFRVTLQ
jgi:alpha-glucosidase